MYSGMNPPAQAPRDPAAQREARDKEIEDYRKFEDIRRYFNDRNTQKAKQLDLIASLDSEFAELLENEERNKYKGTSDSGIGLAQAADSINPYPPKDGIYAFNQAADPANDKPKYNDNEKIKIENGQIRPLSGGLTEGNVRACLNVIGGVLGSPVVVIDLGEWAISSDWMRQRDFKRELDLVVKEAQKQGMVVRYGSNTLAALALLNEKDRTKYLDAAKASNLNAEKIRMEMGISDTKGLIRATKSITDQNTAPGNKLLSGVPDDQIATDLKIKVGVENAKPAPGSPVIPVADSVQVDKIEERIASLNKRMVVTEASTNRLDGSMEAQKIIISSVEDADVLTDIQVKSNKFTGKRNDLIKALEDEHKALEFEIKVWTKDLKDKNAAIRRPLAADASDSDKKKVKQIEDGLAKLADMESKLTKEMTKHTEIKTWEATGRKAEITTKEADLKQKDANKPR